MARSVTLDDLIERVRLASDQENSSAVTDAEITIYINQAITEYYDLMVGTYSEEWGVSPVPYYMYITGSTSTYDLPTSLYKVRAIDKLVSGISGSGTEEYTELRRVNFSDRNRDVNAYSSDGSEYFGYRLLGGTSIAFWPVPQT